MQLQRLCKEQLLQRSSSQRPVQPVQPVQPGCQWVASRRSWKLPLALPAPLPAPVPAALQRLRRQWLMQNLDPLFPRRFPQAFQPLEGILWHCYILDRNGPIEIYRKFVSIIEIEWDIWERARIHAWLKRAENHKDLQYSFQTRASIGSAGGKFIWKHLQPCPHEHHMNITWTWHEHHMNIMCMFWPALLQIDMNTWLRRQVATRSNGSLGVAFPGELYIVFHRVSPCFTHFLTQRMKYSRYINTYIYVYIYINIHTVSISIIVSAFPGLSPLRSQPSQPSLKIDGGLCHSQYEIQLLAKQ